jgi:hypothetical protein
MSSAPVNAATVGYYMNPSDYGSIPKGQTINTRHLNNATPRKGLLNLTQVNTTEIDKAIKACESKTSLASIKQQNYKITANETGCGWVTYGQNQGRGILGNYTTTLGPVPERALHYYPPIATRSPNADKFRIPCSSEVCMKEGFVSMEEDIQVPICSKYTRCEDMQYFDSFLTGDNAGLCAYCTSSKTFVPVNRSKGTVTAKYTTAPCEPSSLITDYKKCPPPTPRPIQGDLKEAFETLAPLDSCKAPLTRDCLVLAATTAGCSPEGTLIASLYNSPPASGYNETLEQEASYRVYQQQMNPNMNILKDTAASIQNALSQFTSLFKSTQDTNEVISGAARDLCIKKNLDLYSFCNDLVDTTIVNSTNIVCLQQKFLNAGGKVSDSNYPSLSKCLGKTVSQCV